MLKLYHAPLARSARVVWLLEELGLPYELVAQPLTPPERPFVQPTPWGKVPVLEDGELSLFESGAILEHILEAHASGRLAPGPGDPERPAFLQWLHFAEATLFPGLGNIAWHVMFKKDAESIPDAIDDYRGWAQASLAVLEKALEDREFLLEEFSAADIAMGYSLQVAKWFGLLDDRWPRVGRYLEVLAGRPAFQKAMSPQL